MREFVKSMCEGTSSTTVTIHVDFSRYWFKRWFNEIQDEYLRKLDEEADSQ